MNKLALSLLFVHRFKKYFLRFRMVRLLANGCVYVYLSDCTNISAKKIFSNTRAQSFSIGKLWLSEKAGWLHQVLV